MSQTFQRCHRERVLLFRQHCQCRSTRTLWFCQAYHLGERLTLCFCQLLVNQRFSGGITDVTIWISQKQQKEVQQLCSLTTQRNESQANRVLRIACAGLYIISRNPQRRPKCNLQASLTYLSMFVAEHLGKRLFRNHLCQFCCNKRRRA